VYVISLIVKNEYGVMQRVMGEFTRNKVNVETIVVGKCEIPGKSRIVLSVRDKTQAEVVLGKLQRLQDVYDAEMVPERGQTAYALISTRTGNVGMVGRIDDVQDIIDESSPKRYVMALNALQ
jgi:acetolactate synthase-1/3 small subunit